MPFVSSIAKYIVNRIAYPHTYNNEVFCNYLRSKGARIGKNTRFVAPKKTIVDDARLDYITIGDNCCFSQVTILAHDYSWYVLKDAFNAMLPDAGGGVTIGNNVFAGYQSVILKGTEIGNNVVIGARAVVKGRIPSNTVWAGVPARQICTLESFFSEKKGTGNFRCTVQERSYQTGKRTRGKYSGHGVVCIFIFGTDGRNVRYVFEQA